MSSINVRQVFYDLEKVFGVNAVLYQCARYMNEKGIPYAIPPSTWLEEVPNKQDVSACEPIAWSDIRSLPVQAERRVRKGWGVPNAPKKPPPTPVSPESLRSVVRNLDFSDNYMRFSPIQFNA